MFRIVCAVLLAIALPTSLSAQDDAVDNSEMAEMFEADQEIRRKLITQPSNGRELIMRMVTEDAERQARTEQLLADGALTSANDFYHAAFIFQHGGDADSYLLAHTLAVAAAARGHKEAPWIAAATLDRYLQEIGQSQIYGTQYSTPAGQESTMEPYNRDLVPDSLRAVLGVPNQVAQAERLKEMRERDARK